MGVNDTWIEGILSEVNVKDLNSHKSWRFPECPLEDNRLSIILSSIGSSLNKFYGCVNAEIIHQFPLPHITEHNKNDRYKITLMGYI